MVHYSIRIPIKANPAKAGGAKLVESKARMGHDSQLPESAYINGPYCAQYGFSIYTDDQREELTA